MSLFYMQYCGHTSFYTALLRICLFLTRSTAEKSLFTPQYSGNIFLYSSTMDLSIFTQKYCRNVSFYTAVLRIHLFLYNSIADPTLCRLQQSNHFAWQKFSFCIWVHIVAEWIQSFFVCWRLEVDRSVADVTLFRQKFSISFCLDKCCSSDLFIKKCCSSDFLRKKYCSSNFLGKKCCSNHFLWIYVQ